MCWEVSRSIPSTPPSNKSLANGFDGDVCLSGAVSKFEFIGVG
jgi:hypothetical protein